MPALSSADALAGMYGHKDRDTSSIRSVYIQAVGPVGGGHYAIRHVGKDGKASEAVRVVPNAELEGFTWFPELHALESDE